MQQKHSYIPQNSTWLPTVQLDIELCYASSSGELSLVLLASNADTKEKWATEIW